MANSNEHAYLAHIRITCAQFQKQLVEGKVQPHLDESRQFLKGVPTSDLNEAQVRQSFILPIVQALGWETGDPFEVFPEERVNGGFADIRLRTQGGESLIWEIKRTKVNLDLGTEDGKEAAYQGVGYARTFSNSPYCLVTNFEQTYIFHSYVLPPRDLIHENLVAKFTWTDLRDNALPELISLLQKAAVESGNLRRHLDEKVKKKTLIRTKKPLAERILGDLERWRTSLVTEFLKASYKGDLQTLDLAIQILINRVLFIRCCEDRGLESRLVVRPLLGNNNIWKSFVNDIFPDFRASYNSDIFSRHPIIDDAKWSLSDVVLKSFLEGTISGTEGDRHEVYDFSIIPLEILGSAYESYIAKQFVNDGAGLKLELKPEIKKSGGVCYTPAHVVDYIVSSTLSAIHKGQVRFLPKVLDPACGSGTFLISVLRNLIDKNRPLPQKKSETRPTLTLKEKKKILEECVFGVDLDPKAVEITKLSLLLQLLEGEREGLLFKTAVLPSLQKNIRCGNSLISPEEAVEHGEAGTLKDLDALDWKGFLKRIDSKDGFDAIVGNPPYVRIQVLQEFYPLQAGLYSKIFQSARDGNVDLYLPFIERALQLCRKSGQVGFILPNRFWANEYGKNVRQLISNGSHLNSVVNFRAEQVFDGVTTYTCVLNLTKVKTKEFSYIEIERNEPVDKFLFGISGRSRMERESILSSAVLKEDPWLLAPEKVRSQIHEMEKTTKRLGDYIERRPGVFQGLISGSDPVFLLTQGKSKNQFFSECLDRTVALENNYIFPVLKGSAGIKSLKIPEVDLRLLFPYSGTPASLEKLSTIRAEAPKTFEYLITCERTLRERSALKTKSDRDEDVKLNPKKFKDPADPAKIKWFYAEDDFYKFSRNQALDCVRRQKLIVPSLFREPTFFWDQHGRYALTGSGSGGGGAYAMYVTDEFKSHALAMVGLLSSDSMKLWFERRGDLFAGYYVGVDEKTLLAVPLPDLGRKDLKRDSEKLSKLVEAILSLGNEEDATRLELMASINSVCSRILSL